MLCLEAMRKPEAHHNTYNTMQEEEYEIVNICNQQGLCKHIALLLCKTLLKCFFCTLGAHKSCCRGKLIIDMDPTESNSRSFGINSFCDKLVITKKQNMWFQYSVLCVDRKMTEGNEGQSFCRRHQQKAQISAML